VLALLAFGLLAALFAFSFLAALFAFGLVAFLLAGFLALVLAGFALGHAFGFAAHGGAVALMHTFVFALLDGGAFFGGGLFGFLVAAGNHGKHGHSSHSGKQNFLHCVLMFKY
jgi:hypothetical protein